MNPASGRLPRSSHRSNSPPTRLHHLARTQVMSDSCRLPRLPAATAAVNQAAQRQPTFIIWRARSSCVTKPSTRVPMGSPFAFTSTQEFLSNLITLQRVQ